MNLTSRSRYALKIMIDLANRQQEPLVRRQDIVRRQGIPSKYLDQILVRLRREGLVSSVRGRTGGYRIDRQLDTITVWDVFRSVEDIIYPVACVDEQHSCEFQLNCVASEPWQLIFDTLRCSLEGLNLLDVSKRFAMAPGAGLTAGTRECRPGREPSRLLKDAEVSPELERLAQSRSGAEQSLSENRDWTGYANEERI